LLLKASAAMLIPSLEQSSAISIAICLHMELQNVLAAGSTSAHFMLSCSKSHPPNDTVPTTEIELKPLIAPPGLYDPPPASASQHSSPCARPCVFEQMAPSTSRSLHAAAQMPAP